MNDGPKDRKFSRRLPAYRTGAQKTRAAKPPSAEQDKNKLDPGPIVEAQPSTPPPDGDSPSISAAPHNPPSRSRRSIPASETILNPFVRQSLHTQSQILPEHALFALLLTIVVVVRLTNLDFNSLHLDEAVNLAIGNEALSGGALPVAARYIAGSHLYPMLAALLERTAGVVGLRAVSAALMAAAMLFVYLAANRVFNSQSALWAAFLFGLTGIGLNLGEYAVADALALPLLTASLYLVTTSILDGRRGRMLLAGIAFGVGAVTSFVTLLSLPALLAWGLLVTQRSLASHAGTIGRAAWGRFLLPLALIIGLYALLGRSDLQALTLYEPQVVNHEAIARTLLRDLGLPAVLALISLPMLSMHGAHVISVSVKEARSRAITAILASVCFLAVWLFAIYHVAALDARWLWQHEVYALVFLALLSGYGLDQIVQRSRAATLRWSIPVRALGAAGMLVLLFGSGASALIQNATWQQSWPNVQPVLDSLAEDGISRSARLWSPVNVIYGHYLDVRLDETLHVTDTAALKRVTAACALDYLILDDFNVRVAWDEFDALMQGNRYDAKYAFADSLSGNVTVTTKVYVPTIPCRFF